MCVWGGGGRSVRGFWWRGRGWLRKDNPRIGAKVAQLRRLTVQVKWCMCVCVLGGRGDACVCGRGRWVGVGGSTGAG